MAMINYADKVALNTNSNIADINKCNATDMNELKNAFNNQVAFGWYQTGLSPTFTYSKWDSTTKTGVVNSNLDLTPYLSAGMKVKFTQSSTIKYGIITKISSSQITLYMGTDYTLNNSGISNAFYSMLKAPYGFPMSKTKWTLSNQITSSTSKTSPVDDTWYNIGGSLTVPVGLWIPKYSGLMAMTRVSTGNVNQYITISTTNNGATNNEYTQKFYGYGNIEVDISVFFIGNPILVERPTTYYLNCQKDTASTDQTAIYLLGGQQTTILQFECAYL